MAARPAVTGLPMPLFAWPEQLEIARLEEDRRALITRIAALRPHSHRRVELQARLKDVTARQMALQIALRARP